jgi:MFS family permease
LSLGTGAAFTIVNSTTSRWFDRKRGLTLGITTSGGALGQIVMAPFATYLISSFDWRIAFVVIGLIAWLVVTSLSLLLIKDPSDIGLLPDGVKAEMVQTKRQNSESNSQLTGLSLRQAFRTRSFWALVFVLIFTSLSVHLIITHTVPHAIDMSISPMNAAFIISLIGGATIFGRLILGRVSDIIGRKALAIGCALVEVGALIWLIWTRELWMFYLFAVFFGLSSGGVGMLTTALIGDIFGVRNIGAIMGATLVGWALGAAIGPYMGGFMFDATGNYFGSFITAAGTMLITTVLLTIIRTETKSEQPQ